MRAVLGACFAASLLLHAGAAEAARKKAERAQKAEPAPPAERKQTLGELAARMVEALGGPALRDLRSRRATGEVEFAPAAAPGRPEPAPVKATLELAWRAPGKAREAWTLPGGAVRRVSDGRRGWEAAPGVKRRPLRTAERAELARLVALYLPPAILPLDGLVLDRADTLDGRAVSVAKTKNGELLWLDAKTALPVRLDLLEERPEPERAGEFSATQVFFSEWRFVGGTQLPHLVRRVRPQGTTTYRLKEVQQNVELPEGLFKKPAWYRK